MKKANIFAGIILVLFLGSFVQFIPNTFPSEPIIIDSNDLNSGEIELIDYMPYDYGVQLRSMDIEEYETSNPLFNSISDDEGSLGPAAVVGDIVQWATIDSTKLFGQKVNTNFELRAIGEHTEIWVQTDLSYPDDRPTPELNDTVINNLLSEFEDTISPLELEYFGTPDFHDGRGDYSSPDGKDVILVSNIRDDMYYDPEYPYFIAGFYWRQFENDYDRNIISIDCNKFEKIAKSVVAHEYQHLIHDDYNSGDDTFMNEGCSMYAEVLCGYGISEGYITAYFTTPDNSLTEWEDQGAINIIADYGAVALWTTYLADQYGGADLISYFVQNGVAGVNGINQALAHFGYSERFEEIYRDWTIANYLLSDAVGNGKYNYQSISIEQDLRVYDVPSQTITDKTGTSFGETVSFKDDGTGIYKISSYGSDYIELSGISSDLSQYLTFDGDDISGSNGFYLTLISMESGVPTAVEFIPLDSSSEETLTPFGLSAMTDGNVGMVVSTTNGLSDYKFSIYNEIDENPTVGIIAPIDGDIVSGTVVISADASDDIGIDHVQYQIDGGSWIVDNTAPYQWNWDTTGLTNGQSYTITVRAYDTINQYAEESISVVVDNEVVDEKPTVRISEPSTGDIVRGTVVISADASDDIGIDHVQYQIDGGSWIVDNTAPYQWNWDTTGLITGETYTITVRAYDTINQYAEESISVIVDNGEVHLVEDIFNGAVAGHEVDYYALQGQPGEMTVTASWSGNTDIDVYICTAEDYSNYLARGYTTNNPETCSYDIQTVGTYYAAVRMYTQSASSTDYTLKVKYYTGGSGEDTTPPTVNIISPVDGAEVSGIVTIEFSATDASGIASRAIMIDGVIVSTSSTHEWDTSSYALGEHVIRCEATDASENANIGHSEITVVITSLEDAILSISAPSEIEPTGSFDVTFGYSAVGERNVVVSLVNGGGSIFASTSISISEGEGEETVTLTHDGTTPSGTDYVIEVKMLDLSDNEVAIDTTPITVKEEGQPASLFTDLALVSIFALGAIGSILLIQKKTKIQKKV